MKNRFSRKLWDAAVLVLGCTLYAVSFNWFFRTSGFVMGGFTGIAQIGNRLIPALPVGTVVFALNLPLIGLFARKEGIGKLGVTLLTITLSSALIDFLAANVRFQPVHTLIAIICGGGLMGLSLGLLLRKNATTGGTELAARLLQYRFCRLSIGRICLLIDLSIIAVYALVFRELANAINGAIAMTIASAVIDILLYYDDKCDKLN